MYIHSTPRRPKEWKEHLRQLVAILTGEESAPDGHILVPLDTDMSRRMTEVKVVTLRILRLVAFDRERGAEVGRCGGFQVSARVTRCCRRVGGKLLGFKELGRAFVSTGADVCAVSMCSYVVRRDCSR